MKEIPLTRGLVAIVDDADHELVSKHNWSADPQRSKFRAVTNFTVPGGQRKVYMHRLILGEAAKGLTVDHKNGNSLDNRRENLRAVTVKQNNWNTPPQARSTVPFKGVTLGGTKRSPYRAEIKTREARYTIGNFPTAEEAARAYDAKAKELFGEFAYVNFPG